jgi:hypothetical protein
MFLETFISKFLNFILKESAPCKKLLLKEDINHKGKKYKEKLLKLLKKKALSYPKDFVNPEVIHFSKVL